MTDLYAVFGNPVAHSRSPEIHALFAAQQGITVKYERRRVEGTLAQALAQFAAEGGRGANVTVPCKEEAFALCVECSDYARHSRAVNTLIRLPEEDGQIRWRGDNTDGIGLTGDIARLNVPLSGTRILLLGAGGAVRGVLPALLETAPAEMVLCNRTVEKARTLAQDFGISVAEADDLSGKTFDIIINGTSASLSGQVFRLPEDVFPRAQLVYDMMYAAQDTPFLAQARACGAVQSADGLGMLVGQAAASYALWQGFTPEITPVLQTVREHLCHA